MKSSSLAILLFLLTFSACSRVFYDYERSKFKYIDQLDRSYVPTIKCFDKVFMMRLDTLDRFIGSEYVRMRDTTSKDSKVQYSYFVFQKNGRVFFNTYADARDRSINRKYDDDYKHIDGQIPKTIDVNDPLNLYSRQGHYSILDYNAVTEKNTSKEIYRNSQGQVFIEIEIERKYNPRLHPRIKNSKHHEKHFIITAKIEAKGDEVIGDTLSVIRIEVPRLINPLTAESSPSKKGNQVMKASEIFAFPLKFVKIDAFPEVICSSCEDSLVCNGCIK